MLTSNSPYDALFFFLYLYNLPLGPISFHDPLDGDGQGIELVHLLDGPHPLEAVLAHDRALMAVLAQGYAGVGAVLLDVVGIRRAGCITDRAI